MGLVIIGALALYLLIAIAVVIGAVRYAKQNGKNAKRWGWSAAFAIFLVPFWDWIPTVVVHHYYCTKDAGFWVYKTPEQWRKENPGVVETLTAPGATGSPVRHSRSADGHEVIDVYLLNERFNWVIAQRDLLFLLPIVITERSVLDTRKNEVLARYIDFSSGNSVKSTVGPPGPIKFWLQNSNCVNGARNRDALSKFRDNFYGLKR